MELLSIFNTTVALYVFSFFIYIGHPQFWTNPLEKTGFGAEKTLEFFFILLLATLA